MVTSAPKPKSARAQRTNRADSPTNRKQIGADASPAKVTPSGRPASGPARSKTVPASAQLPDPHPQGSASVPRTFDRKASITGLPAMLAGENADTKAAQKPGTSAAGSPAKKAASPAKKADRKDDASRQKPEAVVELLVSSLQRMMLFADFQQDMLPAIAQVRPRKGHSHGARTHGQPWRCESASVACSRGDGGTKNIVCTAR
eukprot:6104003-Prymnesium_polylepis.2